MTTSTPTPEISPIHHILNFLYRNRFLIGGVGLFVTFWMLVYTFAVYRPVFAAKSVVIIKDSAITSRYVETEQYYALQTTSSSSSNPVLNTMGILKSGAISDALWAYFSKYRPEQLKKNKIRTKAEWVKFFQDGSAFIKAKNQPGTDLIAIQFGWSDPQVAKEALAVVVKAFQDASRDLNKQEQISRTLFLQRQVTEIESQLQAIRKQKTEYQSLQGTVSVQKEGSDLAGARMEMENKLSQLESQALGKERLAHRYQQMLGMSPEKALKAAALGQNGSLSRLQDELYRLEQNYSQLSSSLTEINPKVQEIKAQIEQVKANIEAEKARTMTRVAMGDTPVVADTNRSRLVDSMLTALGEAQDLRSQAAVVERRLEEVDHAIKGFPSVAEGLANIEQKEQSLSSALDNLRKKALEGKLKEEQTLSNVFVVDAPSLPNRPQFPNRNHLLVLSLMLGLGAGLAVAFAKEQFLDSSHALPDWMNPIENDDSEEVTRPTIETSRPVHPLMKTHADASGVELTDKMAAPRTGSLFDDLLPIAGPILEQMPTSAQKPSVQASQPLREDLMQPLPTALARNVFNDQERQEENPGNVLPVAELPDETLTMEALNICPDEALLPPEVPVAQKPRVRQAAPLQAETLNGLAQAKIPPRPATLNYAPIPSLHSLPTEPAVSVSLNHSTHDEAEILDRRAQLSPLGAAASIEREIPAPLNTTQQTAIQAELLAQNAKNEIPIRFQPQPILQKKLSVEDMVNRLQEAPQPQPKPETAHPANRKQRGLPNFLLDEEQQPSGKALLSPEDNLLSEVAPMEAPADEEILEKRRPLPAFLTEPENTRTPLKVSRFWFRKQPGRKPESYFGLDRRGQKNPKSSDSLNAWRQTLESGPHVG